MRRACVAVLFAAVVVAPVYADVTLKQSAEGKGMGMSGKMPVTTFIKGNKMRTDTVMSDRTRTMIYDVDGQKMYIFDSKKKEADVWDMAAVAQEIAKGTDPSATKASFKPNGQSKVFGARTAAGYDMEITTPAMNDSKDKDMAMTTTLTAAIWIVKDAPGASDFSRFYRNAVERGWIFGDPAGAKASPGQARATAEMYRQIALVGGVPFESTMDIKLNATGPMAAMMSRMGAITIASSFVSVETTALTDDLFAPPADYKLNMKK